MGVAEVCQIEGPCASICYILYHVTISTDFSGLSKCVTAAFPAQPLPPTLLTVGHVISVGLIL